MRTPQPAMTTIAFDDFAAAARAQGFGEVLERRRAPGAGLDTRTHSFAVQTLVVAGEMWLTVDGQTQHLRAGDPFAQGHEVPHAERYGEQGGATCWVARRS